MAAGLGGVAVLGLAAAAIAVALALKPATAIDRMIPASVDGYVAAYLDPSLSQKLNLLGLAHRFPDLKTDADMTAAVDRYLDQMFANSGLTFSRDIRPWLGPQMDFLVGAEGAGQEQTAPAVAFLLVSKDDARAKVALARLRGGPLGKPMAWSDETYRGVAISVGKPTGESVQQPIVYAVVDHTVILATTDPLIKEIIDTDAGKAARLIDSADLRAALRRVPSDKLVFAYVNGQAAARSITNRLSGSSRNPLGASLPHFDQLAATQTIAFAVVAKPTGLLTDLEVKVDPSRLDAATRAALSATGNAATMAGWIPKRAYGFAATATLKASLTALVESLNSDQQAGQQLQEYGISRTRPDALPGGGGPDWDRRPRRHGTLLAAADRGSRPPERRPDARHDGATHHVPRRPDHHVGGRAAERRRLRPLVHGDPGICHRGLVADGGGSRHQRPREWGHHRDRRARCCPPAPSATTTGTWRPGWGPSQP
jgi:hypothetical protein